jgi:hypothetical protein
VGRCRSPPEQKRGIANRRTRSEGMNARMRVAENSLRSVFFIVVLGALKVNDEMNARR